MKYDKDKFEHLHQLRNSDKEKTVSDSKELSYKDWIKKNDSNLYPYDWDNEIKIFIQTFYTYN